VTEVRREGAARLAVVLAGESPADAILSLASQPYSAGAGATLRPGSPDVKVWGRRGHRAALVRSAGGRAKSRAVARAD